MPNYRWKRIEPLSSEEKAIDLAEMRPLYENWRASKRRLQESSQAQLADFNRRLIRRLSIETGILERLYDVDRGTTEALVAHGFAEDLVSHSSTNIQPSRLIDILRDQESAVQLVIDCVGSKRQLTSGLLHELHTILTRHQDTTVAVNQFGDRIEIALLKGKFKELTNNPRREDGTVHEYCPPIHVGSEIDSLLYWLTEYSNEDPIIVGTWLHHRFTQIHPYQDGNGRVARALTTLVLLRADLLPLVIDRDLRSEYLNALELADQSQLSSLAGLFARVERNAILQALSVDADASISHHKTVTSAVISRLADKVRKRGLEKEAELRRVNLVALNLRERAHSEIEGAFAEIGKALDGVGTARVVMTDGGPDRGNAHWYRFDIVQSSKAADKFANFAEDHYFVKGSIRVNRERLVFIVSFHHVGRDLTGIMEAVALSRLESFENSDDRESVSDRFSLCSVEPFVFTHHTKVSEVADAFNAWLDASLAVAMKEYGDGL